MFHRAERFLAVYTIGLIAYPIACQGVIACPLPVAADGTHVFRR